MIIFQQPSGLRFKLDQNNFTAKIIESSEVINDVFIPRSIKYNSQEYIITEIEDGSFSNNYKIYSIIFSHDSEIRSIGQIFNSAIKKLTLPPKIEEFKDGWCKYTNSLVTVNLVESNKNFKYLDDDHNIIVGKTNHNSDDYDIIIFANRNIKHFKVPSSITRIGPYSFDRSSLKFLEFEENSKLTIIDQMAFNYSNLEYIKIPSSLKVLNEDWLGNINHGIQIEISPGNSNFKLNENKTILFGKSDPNNDYFDVIIRSLKSMQNIVIPSYIKRINSYAFVCNNLKSVEFEAGSKLTHIGKYAFYRAEIRNVTIPPTVKYIGECAFQGCFCIESFNLLWDSELRKFPKFFFYRSRIKTINIPKNVEELENDWCYFLTELIEVIISPENKNFKYLNEDRKVIIGKSNKNEENFDVIHFACKNIEKVFIPKSIKYIKPSAFMFCNNLKEIKFEEGSVLKSIGQSSFAFSSIKKIEIPTSLELIDREAFGNCYFLNTFIIPYNSQLKSIKSYSFSNTPIRDIFLPPELEDFSYNCLPKPQTGINISISNESKHFKFLNKDNKIIICKSNQSSDEFDSIFFSNCDIEAILIPSSIHKICSHAFSNCKKLKKVEFEKNSQLRLIESSAFNHSSIEEIRIPSSVEYIDFLCFSNCEHLNKIEFEENSKLYSFCKYLFEKSNIECISIPSSLKRMETEWNKESDHLKRMIISPSNKMFSYIDENHQLIGGKSNENENHFDVLLFASSDCTKVVIPSTIKQIEAYSFANLLIEELFIPKSVCKICSNAFYNCKNLKKVEFEQNSELIEIEGSSFSKNILKNFVFPEKMKFVDLGSFQDQKQLKSIEFLANEVYVDGHVLYQTLLLSFPNSNKIKIDETKFTKVSAEFRLFACANVEIFSDWSFLFK